MTLPIIFTILRYTFILSAMLWMAPMTYAELPGTLPTPPANIQLQLPMSPNGTLTHNATSPSFSLEVLRFGDKQSPTVYLTFDDGPDPRYTPKILSILRKYNIKATFFLLGSNVKKHPDIAQAIYREGHPIGNHTYHHINMHRRSRAAINQEILSTQKIIKKTTGVQALFFRPPYGIITDQVLQAAQDQQIKIVMWSIDPEDYLMKKKYKLIQKIMGDLSDGSIILLHDTSKNTMEALEYLIKKTREHNFQFALLDESIKGEPSQYYYSKTYQRKHLLLAKHPMATPGDKFMLKINTTLQRATSDPTLADLQTTRQQTAKSMVPDKLYVVQLDENTDLLSIIRQTVRQHQVEFARIEVSGSIKKAMLAHYQPTNKKYQARLINKPLEIMTCYGDAEKAGNLTKVRLQAGLNDDNDNLYGGRLTPGTIMYSGELVVQSYKTK